LRTQGGDDYDLDLIIFALGFHAFTGRLDAASIRNEHGAGPTDSWEMGPRTYLGLMTTGFPTVFSPDWPGAAHPYWRA
jgi:cyclohexanone monooxygenase